MVETSRIRWVASMFARQGQARVIYDKHLLQVQLRYRTVVAADAMHMAQIFGTALQHPTAKLPYPERWEAYAHGSFAIAWIMMIYGLVPCTRQAYFLKVLRAWRDFRSPIIGVSYTGRHPRKPGLAAECHPQRANYANGLCKPCYETSPKRRAYYRAGTKAVQWVMDTEGPEALPPLPVYRRQTKAHYNAYMRVFEQRRRTARQRVQQHTYGHRFVSTVERLLTAAPEPTTGG